MNTPLPLGKLPADQLARLLAQHPITDPRVVLGPRVGEDAAVLDLGARYLVAKSDPITFAADNIGWYAVHVNANDVACSGAAPRWFLATLLLPEGRADAAMAEDIVAQIALACEEIGATLVGGHTEITYGLDRPVVVGAMLGEVAPERLVTTGGARPGDAIVLTKRVAVEATAIIAQEKRDELIQRHGLDANYVDRCADFICRPGISVVRAAQVATGVAPIHAMHDPTEGGLATGLWELAQAAGVGLEIDAQAVPTYPQTRVLCDLYGLDPWGVIGSGSLLLSVDPGDAGPICAALTEVGVEATTIGRVTPRESGVTLRGGLALPTFARDEITRLFE
jgi:hydrogenase maturation factor